MRTKDPDQMNDKRVLWAQTALDALEGVTQCDSGEEALRDLITDLRHWADKVGIRWEESFALAMRNYWCEVNDE